MSNIPADLKYLSSHEWARVEADGTLTVGISDQRNRRWVIWCSSKHRRWAAR
jgi:glycine cleavage system H lipoate-binding protein